MAHYKMVQRTFDEYTHESISDINERVLACCNRQCVHLCLDILNNSDKVNLRYVNSHGLTILMTACDNRVESVCDKILESPLECGLGIRDSYGDTALWYACKRNLKNVCLKIMKYGHICGLNDPNYNLSLFDYICKANMEEVCLKLIRYPLPSMTEKSLQYIRIFERACREEMSRLCIRLLNDISFPVNSMLYQSVTILWIACYYKMENVCLKIVSHNKFNISHVDSVPFLSNNGIGIFCNYKYRSKTVIDMAREYNMNDLIKKMVPLMGPTMLKKYINKYTSDTLLQELLLYNSPELDNVRNVTSVLAEHNKEMDKTCKKAGCIICYDDNNLEQNNHYSINCGHVLSMCESCKSNIANVCPVCKVNITDIKKAYLVE